MKPTITLRTMNKLHSIASSFLLVNDFSTETLITSSKLWQREEYYPISKCSQSRKCI